MMSLTQRAEKLFTATVVLAAAAVALAVLLVGSATAATITYTGTDATTGSNWIGTYGTAGYDLLALHFDTPTGNYGTYRGWNGTDGNVTSLPSFISSVAVPATTVWSGNGNFGRIQDPSQAGNPLVNAPAVLPQRGGGSITINRSIAQAFQMTVFVGVSSDAGFPNNAYTFTLSDGSGTAAGNTAAVPVGGQPGTPGMAYVNFEVGAGVDPLTLSFSGDPINLAGFGFSLLTSGSSVWTGGNSGNVWGASSNWSPATVPDGQGSAVTFGEAASAGNGVVTLDASRTVGTMHFLPDVPTTISATSGSVLTLDNGADPAAVLVAGTHAIDTDVRLNSSATVGVAGGEDSLSFGGVVSGLGNGITKSGAGRLVLSRINTYTEGTTINGGTVNINSDRALGSVPSVPATNVTFSGNGTLQWGAQFDLSPNRNISVADGIIGTIDTQANNVTFRGSISGAGGLGKTGSGTLTLAVAGAYTGPTTINNGTVIAASLGSSSRLVLGGASSQGTLEYTGGDTAIPGGITVNAGGGQIFNEGSGTITVSGPVHGAANGSLTIAGAGNTAFVGTVSLGSGGLTKNGAGLMVLNAPANYTGATTIALGTLRLMPVTGPPTSGMVLWLDAANTSTIQQNNGYITQWDDASGSGNHAVANLGVGPTYQATGLNGLPTVNINGAAQGLLSNFNLANQDITLAVVYQNLAGGANGSLFGHDAGGGWHRLQLLSNSNGPNSYGAGGYSVAVPGVNAAGTQRYLLVSQGGVANGSRIYLNGALAAGPFTDNNPGGNPWIALGNIDGGGGWTSNVNLSEVIGYYGALSNADQQALDAYLGAKWSGLLPSNSPLSIASGAVLDVNGMAQTIGPLSGAGTVTLGTGTAGALTVNSIGDSTFSGVVLGNGSLLKTGSGTLTLTSDQTIAGGYNGVTTVNAGTLQVNGPDGKVRAVTVTSGGALGGTGRVGTITAASGGHVAPGAGGVGTLTTGTLSLQDGSILDFGFGGTANDSTIVVSNSGGLSIDGGGFNLYQEGTTTRFDTPGRYKLISYSGDIGGTGISALSVLNKNFSLRYSVGASGGWITLDIGSGPVWTGNASPDANWNTAHNWSGDMVPANGDMLTFAGTNNVNTNNDLGSGPFVSLQFQADAGAFTLGGGGVTLTADTNNGYAVVVNNSTSNQTVNLPITVQGAAASINAAAGSITINSTIDNGGNTLTVTGSADTTVSGSISGTGGLTKRGAGALTLGGINTYTGATTVQEGTLRIAAGGSVSTGGTNLWNIVSSSGTSATLEVAGGTLNSTGFTLDIGDTANVSATFNMTGGSATINSQFVIGARGIGAGTQSNGDITVTGTMFIGGYSAGGIGTYSQTGGTVSISTLLSYPGNGGGGAYNLSGGTLTTPSIRNDLPTNLGVFNFNGGVLKASADNNSFIQNVATRVQSGGAIIDTDGHSVTVSSNLVADAGSTGGLTKQGDGTLVLNGTNTYSGATTITRGILQLGATTGAAPPTHFAPVAGSVLWLDASDASTLFQDAGGTVPVTGGGQAIGFWADKSGNAKPATQDSAARQPTYANSGTTIGGKPVVAFDGLGQRITSSLDINAAAIPNLSLFILYRQVADTANSGLWGHDDGGWDRFQLLNFTNGGQPYSYPIATNVGNGRTPVNGMHTTDPLVYCAVLQQGVTGGSYVYVNGLSDGAHGLSGFLSSDAGGSPSITFGSISSAYDGYFGNIQIAEVLAYASALSDTDRQAVEDYLAGRWLYGTPSDYLPATSAVTVAAGATLDVNGHIQAIGSLAGEGSVTLGYGALILGGNDAEATFSGGISGTGAIAKTGPGKQILSGYNTYSGGTTVNDGTLVVGNVDALPPGGALTIGAGGSVVLASGLSVGAAGSMAASPVPEPSTLLLAMVALCGLAVWRRKRG